MLLQTDDSSILHLENDQWEGLTSHLQQEIVELADESFNWDHEQCYRFFDTELAERILTKVRNRLKALKSTHGRRWSLETLSHGTYTPEDIEDIYELQARCCYYTGEPLVLEARQYVIDHILPITEGGSSWPGNLALTTRSVNSRKGALIKRAFFKKLEAVYGKTWRDERMAVCRTIDTQRRRIDKARKATVDKELGVLVRQVEEMFPNHLISHELNDGVPYLYVDHNEVRFAGGFLKRPQQSQNPKYIAGVVSAIVGRKPE